MRIKAGAFCLICVQPFLTLPGTVVLFICWRKHVWLAAKARALRQLVASA